MPTKRIKPAASSKAHNVKEEVWAWFEAPDNRLRLSRFGAAMNGVKNMTPPEAILEGSLTLCSFLYTSSPLVDIKLWWNTPGRAPRGFADRRHWRRRVGPQSLVLANHHPHLWFYRCFQTAKPVVRDAVSMYVYCYSPSSPKVLDVCRRYDLRYSIGRRGNMRPTQSNPAA